MLLDTIMRWGLARKSWPQAYVIPDPFTGEEYLLRFVLVKSKLLSVYLHRFKVKDGDRALHNHPWLAAASVILKGSYTEQRAGSKPRLVRWFNWITCRTYHRIADLHGATWSLFWGLWRMQDWGFIQKGVHVPHEEYFRRLREAA